jgi:tetratricopeptide (TPR) repeat protein
MHALDLPDWTLKVVVAVLAAGFPVTSALAWVFDIKNTGGERTPSANPAAGPERSPGLARARLALLLLGLGVVAAAPGERIPVAVADFENDTGESELDALSGLLTTSLEQSRRLEVLTRSRMVDILRQMGHASIPLYTIEMKALDPTTSAYLFTLKENGKGKAGIPDMIDRLSAQTRERLRERPSEVASSRVKVAEAITPSLTAYQHYFNAKALQYGLGDYPGAVREYQRAVAVDPGFALAQYELSYLGVWTDLPEAERRAALDAAMRNVERLPEKERFLVLAWKAHQDGKDDEADAIYRKAVQAYPREKEIQFHAGDLLYHQFLSTRGSSRDLTEVLPFFEAAVALDPSDGEAQGHLVPGLLFLGRDADAVAASRSWAKAAPSARAFSSLGAALAAAGMRDEALQAFQRSADMGAVPAFLQAYARTLAQAGRFEEAQRVLGSASADGWPGVRLGMGATQAEVLLYQGRYREALGVLDAMPEEAALPERAGIPARFRTAIHASTGSADLASGAARKLVEAGGGVDLVPVDLALVGDGAHAAEAAQLLDPGSRQLRLYQAVAAWRSGRLDEGAAGLQANSNGKYAPDRALATALLGELEAGRGRDAPAIENLERYRTTLARQSGARAAIQLPRTLLLREGGRMKGEVFPWS